MTVLVGYVPTSEGEAAFAAALQEAKRRAERLVLLNSARRGAPVSMDVAPEDELARITGGAQAEGVQLAVRQHTQEGVPCRVCGPGTATCGMRGGRPNR